MVDFVFTSKKQYWSAVKNLHKNLTTNSDQAIKIRNSFASLTGNKKYKQENYIKRLEKGKSFSLEEVRKDFAKAKQKQEKYLREDYLREKKKGNPEITTWKKFKEANQEPDYDAIAEGYNSPH